MAATVWTWWPPWVLLFLLLMTTATGSPDWTDCPASCHCKWTSGKKTALCREAGFTAIPNTLNSDMQVLDLNGNDIPYLTKDAFRSVGLINLQRIFMRGTGVREIHRDAFRDLKILVEVDLSDNAVMNIHPDTFTGNDRLRVLILNGNPLTELRERQFPTLPHLRNLELQDCQLKFIHNDAFVNVTMLESLNLKSNQLRQLSDKVFSPIQNLKTLILDGNPWRCDCDLREFRNWLLKSNLYSIPLTCSSESGKLTGRFWEDVPPREFACAPEVNVSEKMVQEEVGGNVTFRCQVRGDPEPEVNWFFNGRLLGPGSNGNSSYPEQVYIIEEEESYREKWANLSVYNVTEQDAGEYSCVARNTRGVASRNVSLILPQVVTATTLSKAESWLLWAGIVAGGIATLCSALLTIVCSCCMCGRQRRRRKHHRRKAKLKGSVSFTEQEKKLLDVSITTTERPSGGGSCEGLGSQPEMELLEQSQSIPLELCEPPVHITIESHASEQPTGGGLMPVGGAYPGTLAVFPPPPEFSTSLLPAGAFGNIFISVSVSQEPNAEGQRYPDLLDIPHRSKAATTSVSVAAGPDAPYCPIDIASSSTSSAAGSIASYATLPRRHLRSTKDIPVAVVVDPLLRAGGPQYDNMGPRVTAGGSSTLSLPDTDLSIERPGFVEDIPPPPLPPLCIPMPSEYVAL